MQKHDLQNLILKSRDIYQLQKKRKKKKKWKWYTNEKDIITKLYNLASKNYSSIRDMVGDKKMDLKKDLVKKLSLINKKSVWKHRKNIS